MMRILKNTLVFIGLCLAFVAGKAQSTPPNAMAGANHIPVWTHLQANPEGYFIVRTMYSLPCHEDSTGEMRTANRIFMGVGKAVYGPDGDLLYFEEGYGATKRTRIQPDSLSLMQGMESWVAPQEGKSGNIIMHNARCRRYEWEDKLVEDATLSR